MSETTETSTPEPARDGSGAVGVVDEWERSYALALFTGTTAEDMAESLDAATVSVSASLRSLLLAAAARLLATPPAAVAIRCPCGEPWEVIDDGVPYCAACWSSVNGHEAATPWAGTCPACVSHYCGHTGKPGACPVAAAGAEADRIGAAGFTQPLPALAYSVTLPAPTPAPAGGDVAAAVDALQAAATSYGYECALPFAHTTEKRAGPTCVEAKARVLAAHEAAVRAVDTCRTCDGEMIVECQHGVPGLEACAPCPTCDGTGKRVPDAEIQRLRAAAGDLQAERARAEATVRDLSVALSNVRHLVGERDAMRERAEGAEVLSRYWRQRTTEEEASRREGEGCPVCGHPKTLPPPNLEWRPLYDCARCVGIYNTLRLQAERC